jgi:mono/diheme cytochrome c family protein
VGQNSDGVGLAKMDLSGRRILHRITYLCAVLSVFIFTTAHLAPLAFAQSFHGAPASTAQTRNPYSGDSQAATGKKLYGQNCSQCHGNNLQGIGPAPALTSLSVKHAPPGELLWFITNGDLSKGMPSWSQLTNQQRWQIVTFLQSQNSTK